MQSLTNNSYEQVYYVNSDKIFNHLAIRPKVRDRGQTIEWQDTARGIFLECKEIKIDPPNSKTPSTIEIVTKKGDKVTLKALDLLTYNREIKEYVGKSPEFATQEDLVKFFLSRY